MKHTWRDLLAGFGAGVIYGTAVGFPFGYLAGTMLVAVALTSTLLVRVPHRHWWRYYGHELGIRRECRLCGRSEFKRGR